MFINELNMFLDLYDGVLFCEELYRLYDEMFFIYVCYENYNKQ